MRGPEGWENMREGIFKRRGRGRCGYGSEKGVGTETGTCLCILLQVGEHDNGGDVVVPHHPPEVTQGVRKGSLCGYELLLRRVPLLLGRGDMVNRGGACMGVVIRGGACMGVVIRGGACMGVVIRGGACGVLLYRNIVCIDVVIGKPWNGIQDHS